MKANGFGKDIWTLSEQQITNVVKVRTTSSILGQQVSNKPAVHLGHTSLVHPSHLPDQDRHHLHLYPSLPPKDLSDGMLGHHSTLRPFHGVDDYRCHPSLRPRRGCLDELEGNKGGCLL